MNTRTAALLLFVADCASMMLAFFGMLELAPSLSAMLWEPATALDARDAFQTLRFGVFIAVVALFLFYNRGHYTQRVPWWGQVQYVLQTLGLCWLVTGFGHYALHNHDALLMISLFWLLALTFILIFRKGVQMLCRRIGRWTIPAIIIGDRQNTLETLFTLSQEKSTGYDVHSILLRDRPGVNIDPLDLPVDYRNIPIQVGINGQVAKYIREHTDKFYIIALDTFRGEERDNIVALMQQLQIPFVIVLPIKRVSLYGMEPHFFFGHDTMFLRLRRDIESPLGRLTKRVFDTAVALGVMIALIPFWIVVIALIRSKGGNVFFGHKRVGRHGRHFKCWKFCTMVPNADEILKKLLESDPVAKAEWEKDFKLKNDPRVTSIGKFLRKTSLDELPQLWNVLKGEMSLVGPRPIVEAEKAYYGDNLEYYLAVKPGVTGLWQASGRNNTSYEQRVLFDSWYVRNWSLWNDVVILIKTVRALFFGHGAY